MLAIVSLDWHRFDDGNGSYTFEFARMNRIVPNRQPLKRIIEKELSYLIVGAFYETYNELLGFGHSESTYSNSLAIALQDKGLKIDREHPVEVFFRNKQVGHHRLDMLAEGRVVIEIKATERLADHAKRQVVTYLAATGLQLGILLHFGPTAEYHRILHPALIRPNSMNSLNSKV